jgi:hypothetical protein
VPGRLPAAGGEGASARGRRGLTLEVGLDFETRAARFGKGWRGLGERRRGERRGSVVNSRRLAKKMCSRGRVRRANDHDALLILLIGLII